MGNAVNLPVMITMQGNSGRNDVLNPIIPQPFYPVIQQYPYTNNNTIPYNTEIPNSTGSISLSSVTPNINVSQVVDSLYCKWLYIGIGSYNKFDSLRQF